MTEPVKFIGRAKVRPKKDTLFLPFQEKWINDPARLKLMEKSRQIGISWSSAYSLVRRKSLKTARLDGWVSSRDEIQARLFVEDCVGFAKILNIGAEDLGEQALSGDNGTSFVVKFANGLRINSLSSSPDAQAGKRGDRLLDEFALHKDPRKLWSIAYPGITWGGQMELVSTHRGTDNFFNELVVEAKEKGNPKGISLHTVTLQNALDQGFLYKLQCKLPEGDERQLMDEAEYFDFIRRGCADEDSFQQEYMCVPVDGNTIFIDWDLIIAAEEKLAEAASPAELSAQSYIGLDIGRHHDLTVAWINDYVGGRHLTRKIIELQNVPFSTQEAELWPWFAKANRVCIDATGLGEQFAERAAERFGTYKIEAVKFTAPVKESLAYPLRNAMEDRNFKMPFDQRVRQSFRGIKKELTSAGNIRFAGERGVNGHCDHFWAAALAVHAAGPENLGPCLVESAAAAVSGNPGSPSWMRPNRNTEPQKRGY